MIHDSNANIDIITENILSITQKCNDLWFVYSHDDEKFIYESTDFDIVIQFVLEFYSKN